MSYTPRCPGCDRSGSWRNREITADGQSLDWRWSGDLKDFVPVKGQVILHSNPISATYWCGACGFEADEGQYDNLVD